MATDAIEDLGIVEVGHWSDGNDGKEYLLIPTTNIRRFRLKRRPPERRISRVSHRRHQGKTGRTLTEGP
jgi:hypothetical protein